MIQPRLICVTKDQGNINRNEKKYQVQGDANAEIIRKKFQAAIIERNNYEC
jgi:hypothetical protein